MDSGTGCVHTAPGFGADDYETCKPLQDGAWWCPVDDQGCHTDYAGKYAGLKTEESNPVILTRPEGERSPLRQRGDRPLLSPLLALQEPHHLPGHPPVVLLRGRLQGRGGGRLRRCSAGCPAWGKDRMISMIRERADWCISRQRRWGLPIPVFYCDDCGKPIVHRRDHRGCEQASSARRAPTPGMRWRPRISCQRASPAPTAAQGRGFTKEEDTLDGWFDSGSTHFASMQKDQNFWPADMYLEGLDQYRGWFQSSLLTAVGALGQGAPFKECVTHGWTVDGEGKAMHKSLGNGVDPAEIFKKYGADLLRLWAGSADYHVDVRCSDNIFKQLSQNYLKFRNTARYCLGNLDGFDPDHLVSPEEMLELDRWAVTKLNELIRKCFAAYDNYEFHVVSHAINDFCVVELSSFYLDIIKDRLYCEGVDSLERRSAQTALWMILDTITKLFAPILAFTCDEIWQAMPHREGDDPRNVVLNEMNQPFQDYDMGALVSWTALIQLRDGVNAALEAARNEKKIGKSLEAHITLVRAQDQADNLTALQEKFQDQWADLFIVSDVEVSDDPALYAQGSDTPIAGVRVLVSEANGDKCERCWKHHPLVGANAAHPTLCPRCAKVVQAIHL